MSELFLTYTPLAIHFLTSCITHLENIALSSADLPNVDTFHYKNIITHAQLYGLVVEHRLMHQEVVSLIPS